MNKSIIAAAALACLGLAGCGTPSSVDTKGTTDNPVFPDAENVSFVTGSYPEIDNLRTVQTSVQNNGMTRDQLYNLLGRPHFAEGFKVREWDYLFHFNTDDGLETCQFKVLFDKDRIARSYHWAPQECEDLISPREQPAVQPFSLSGDVGFEFGSAVLTAAGLEAVRDVARQLEEVGQVDLVRISGHTDRIGDAAFNQRLSQQRADSVARVLAQEGIPARTIQAAGYGQTQPRVQCHDTGREALIACLAPNRRVDIEVQATSRP